MVKYPFLVTLLLNLTLLCNVTYSSDQSVSYRLYDTFSSSEQRIGIKSFMDNVLRQGSSSTFMKMVDDIIVHQNGRRLTDRELYGAMLVNYGEIRTTFSFIKVMQLINYQRKLIGNQIKELTKDIPLFHHCLEIGTPGTYVKALRKKIRGDIYVVNTQERSSDILQARSLTNVTGGFKGYDHFVPLNDYEPLSESIPDKSIDCVLCFIGLHHIPVDKLDAFIASIKRVLRPGGILLLREHDANSSERFNMAFVAHTIFNVVIADEPLKTEMQEIRNFKSIDEWIALLDKAGFSVGVQRVLQEGDSTFNTLIKCTKRCESDNDRELLAIADAAQQHNYKRDVAQTYFTTPEWNNVDASQKYSEFIEHTPFYEYPYMEQVKTFWKGFGKSWQCAAQEKGGHLKTLFDPHLFVNYTAMNLFVGTAMTLEYTAKALISLPIRAALSGVEPDVIASLVHDPENKFVAGVEGITIRQSYEGNIKCIEMPRYKKFTHMIKQMAQEESSLSFITIAGNDHIACKVRYKKDNVPMCSDSCVQKFSLTMPTEPDFMYGVYAVPVKELLLFIKAVEGQNAEVLYIHDF